MELEARNDIPRQQLFRATVDALELEGTRLLYAVNEVQEQQREVAPKPEKRSKTAISLKDVFKSETENKND
jgi:hypothetical protein